MAVGASGDYRIRCVLGELHRLTPCRREQESGIASFLEPDEERTFGGGGKPRLLALATWSLVKPLLGVLPRTIGRLRRREAQERAQGRRWKPPFITSAAPA